MEKKEKMSFRRRTFLIAIGFVALFLDKLEGRPADPQPVTTGRIEIID
jgi:hypothetical protein